MQAQTNTSFGCVVLFYEAVVLRSFSVAGHSLGIAGLYNMFMIYVYILQSEKDFSLYTGFTTNLKKRIDEHNSGSNTYSSSKKPFRLKWYCAFDNKPKALEFERYLKHGSGFAFARKLLYSEPRGIPAICFRTLCRD